MGVFFWIIYFSCFQFFFFFISFFIFYFFSFLLFLFFLNGSDGPPYHLLHGGNVNYYKCVYQPIPTTENREHSGNFQEKSVGSAFKWVLPFYFLKWSRYFSDCKRTFLESTTQFSFKMLHQYSVPSSKTPLYFFLAQSWYTLLKRSPLKCKFFRF